MVCTVAFARPILPENPVAPETLFPESPLARRLDMWYAHIRMQDEARERWKHTPNPVLRDKQKACVGREK
jgi:hypothetical protein